MTLRPNRRQLLQTGLGAAVTGSLGTALAAVSQAAGSSGGARQPVLFIGHGSPMNAISDNAFTRALGALGPTLPRPRAILVVSAHWLTPGATLVDIQERPPTIHDFGGFPKALFDVQYPAAGHPEMARQTLAALSRLPAAASDDWGLDHGTWSVLRKVYPTADVPTFQVSIDYGKPASFHLQVGRELASLRNQGVLIVGSGNIVHNLRATDRHSGDTLTATQPWAEQFDRYVAQALAQGDSAALLRPQLPAGVVSAAVPTPDHYFPLLYSVGAAEGDAATTVFEGFQSGTLSMRTVRFG